MDELREMIDAICDGRECRDCPLKIKNENYTLNRFACEMKNKEDEAVIRQAYAYMFGPKIELSEQDIMAVFGVNYEYRRNVKRNM